MGKIRELVRQGWRHWYVRLALLGPVSLWGLLTLLGAARAVLGAREWASLTVSVAMNGSPEAWKALRQLEWLSKVQEFATELTVVACLSFILGYVGFSLDAGYKWLRKRRAPKAPES
jgi:hypothetical protein